MFGGYQVPPARISEMLDTLKKEFDALAHDVNRYKNQRDEYERKGSKDFHYHFYLFLLRSIS